MSMKTLGLGIFVAWLFLAAQPVAAAPPQLSFPLACEIGRTCEIQHYVDRQPGLGVRDYNCGRRTNEGHSGLDIRLRDLVQQRAGVAVLAAAPGRVVRLRDGVQDISVRAAGAPSADGMECGNAVAIDHGDGWETRYCHMARGSVRVKVGDMVVTGQPIGRVGLSGQTEYPHLHLTVVHDGKVVDPFRPDMAAEGCGLGGALWTPAALQALVYKPATVLNAGFAGAALTLDQVEARTVAPFTPTSPYVLFYVRATGLLGGDVTVLTLTGPDGRVLATAPSPALDHDQAQNLHFAGRKRPAAGWPVGVYRARYQLRRSGKMLIDRQFTIKLGAATPPSPR